jgi:hypothetical protein
LVIGTCKGEPEQPATHIKNCMFGGINGQTRPVANIIEKKECYNYAEAIADNIGITVFLGIHSVKAAMA